MAHITQALVSIITPAYNAEKYISQTIDAVLRQTYTNWEMIIVDDCSSDNTAVVVTSYADSRIKYLKNEKKSGAAISRNRALREARGKWIAFLDSDDLWLPEKLEKQVSFMEKKGCHFSYTNYSEIDEDGKSRGILWTGPKRIGRIRMTMFNYMGCLTVMYDREVVGLVQVADIKKRNDYAIWVKVVKKCPAYLLDENLATYRIRSSGSLMERGQNPLRRIIFHYELWRKSEGKTIFSAILLAGTNVVFGVIKKVCYKKLQHDEKAGEFQ